MLKNDLALVLLDETISWNGDSRVLVNWSGINVPKNQESLPLKVEETATKIKREYLKWIYDLGRFKLRGKTLISHLKLSDSFSFWWMTSIAEKSTYKSSSIYQVFKLRTLEQLYLERACHGLIYCGYDLNLHRTLKQWCRSMGHPYHRHSSRKCEIKSDRTGLKNRARKFPFWIQAIIYLLRRWFLKLRHLKPIKISSCAEKSNNNQITIVTYFPNIDLKKTKSGRFWSRYWESLHELLDKAPIKVNWIWLQQDSSEIDYKETIKLQEICNQAGVNKYRHFLLEDFLSTAGFLKSLYLYSKLYFTGLLLKEARKAFCFPDSKLNFFPIMEYDWESSLFGHTALDAAMIISMYSTMAKELPEMRSVVYLLENHSWELALIASWKQHQENCKVIGFHHTPGARPLELKLYFDPNQFNETGINILPLPDALAINGAINQKLIQDFGYPLDKFYSVEGLRSFNISGQYGIAKNCIKDSNRTLLVVTGFVSPETEFQLDLLNEANAFGGLTSYSRVLIKPHPDLPIEKILREIKPGFKYEVVNQSLSELRSQTDVVYCANSTTVCVEAAWLGFPVIISSPINAMNLNPLFGFPGLNFISNPEMLSKELQNPVPVNIPEEYFYLDEDLTRWKKLIQGFSRS